MSGFGILHLKRVAAHPVRVLLAVGGIVAGTALIVVVLGLYASIQHSVDELVALAGDADLEVTPTSDTGLAPDAADRLVSVPGVDEIAPLVRTDVVLDGSVVLLVGADARSLRFAPDEVLASVAAPAEGGPDALRIPAPLAGSLDVAQGGSVTLHSTRTGTTTTATIGAVLDDARLDVLNGANVAFTSLDGAQRLTGSSATDALLVRAAPDVRIDDLRDRVRDALGPAVLVETRSERAERIGAPAITYLSQVGPVAGMGLVVGGFLVFNTVNMNAMERRRELATLRVLGASRRRVVLGLVGEAAVLAVVGALGGLALGIPLAARVVDELPAAMEMLLGTDVVFAMTGPLLVVVVGISVTVAVAAAIAPALRVTRPHPLETLRPSPGLDAEPAGVGWRATIGGSALVLTGIAVLTMVRDDRAAPGLLLVALGAIVATHGLSGPIAVLASRIARLGGGLGHLASSGLRRSPQRVWATTMAIALAVAMTVAVAGGARNQIDVDRAHLAELRNTDLWVSTRSLDQIATDVRLPGDWPELLAGIDGIAATAALTTQEVAHAGKNVLVYGAEAPDAFHRETASFPMLELASPDARARTLAGEAVIVTRQFARAFDSFAGDTLELHGARSSLSLPVADVVHTLAVSDNGMVVMADERLREAFGTTGVSTIDVVLEDGADLDAVRTVIEQVGAGQPFPVVVGTGEEGYQAILGGIVAATRLMYGVLVVTTLIAGMAVLNTLAASLLDRWRELGVLRAVGTTPSQLAGIVGLEAAGIGACGALVGILIGELVHWAGVSYVGSASPLPAEFAFEPDLTLIAALGGVAATIVGSLLPIRRAARVDVLEAIAWE